MTVKLDLFNNEADAQRVEPGHTIFRAGDEGDFMYVVLDGEVELHIGPMCETLGPGEVFGEMALIDHSPRVANAVAKSTCRLVAIPEKRFLFMIQQTPHFAIQIMRVMADRLRKMDARSAA